MKKKRTYYPQWFIDELACDEDKEKAKEGLLSTVHTVSFVCTCGQIYNQKITNHIKLSTGERKYGNCPSCRKKQTAKSYRNTLGTNKPYPQWFIDELVHDEDKDNARNGVLKSSDHVDFMCTTCGTVYNQLVSSHISLSTFEKRKGCPVCGVKKQIESKRKSQGVIKPYPQWFIDDLYLDSDKELARTTNFLGKEEKTFYCKVHDIIYKQSVRNHIDLRKHTPKAGCPQCSLDKQKQTLSTTRIYPQWFIDLLVDEEDKIKAKKGTLRSHDIVTLTCHKHGNYKKSVYSCLGTQKDKLLHGCPLCGKKTYFESLSEYRTYPEWFIDDLYLDADKERARLGKVSTTEKLKFICQKGHIYEQWVRCHIILSKGIKNRGCPDCSRNRSDSELEIDAYIQSLGVKTQHRRFDSSNIGMFEIDIFIPDRNIGIEYNGSYYHKTLPIDDYVKPRMYHNQKYYACKELGIRLVNIFDVDWETKKEKIKQFLRHIIKKDESSRIYARKCDVKKISYQDANKMYESYHLLGKTSVIDVSYGLFYKNQLISCMSFQKGRYKEDNNSVWCLSRFVSIDDYIVIGGASKLLSYFEKSYKPKILVSYSDNDYFSGNVYGKLGFVCLGDTNAPRYFWNYHGKEIPREQTQLKKLCKKYPSIYLESLENNASNKEDYIMLKLGAYKVFRSGHTKWIKKYK